MFFTCDVRDLNRAIKVIRRHCSSRAVIPITQCIRFEAMREKVSLATTDMTTSAVYTMEVEDVMKTGTLAIPLKELSALCSKLRGRVSLCADVDSLSVDIINGDDKYRLSCFPGEEFPEVIFNDEYETVTLPLNVIEKALRQVRPTVASTNEESRQIMTGVLVEVDSGKLTMVGTDGRRIGVFQTDISGEHSASVIVRPESLSSCLEAGEKVDDIEIGMSRARLRMSVPGYRVFTQRLEGRYVDYRKVVPEHFSGSFRVSREALIDIVERSLIFAQDKDKPGIIRCNFYSGPQCLKVESFTAGLGQASGSIPGIFEGDDLYVGWNGNYILDALNVLDCDEVLWQTQGPTKSAQLSDPQNPLQFRYVVMPVKLRDVMEETA